MHFNTTYTGNLVFQFLYYVVFVLVLTCVFFSISFFPVVSAVPDFIFIFYIFVCFVYETLAKFYNISAKVHINLKKWTNNVESFAVFVYDLIFFVSFLNLLVFTLPNFRARPMPQQQSTDEFNILYIQLFHVKALCVGLLICLYVYRSL